MGAVGEMTGGMEKVGMGVEEGIGVSCKVTAGVDVIAGVGVSLVALVHDIAKMSKLNRISATITFLRNLAMLPLLTP